MTKKQRSNMRMRVVGSAGLVMMLAPIASAQTTFAFDHRGPDNLFSFPVNDPLTQTQIGFVGGLDYAPFAMDFDTAGTTLYVIDHITGVLVLGTVDMVTGVFTKGPVIVDPLPNATGLSIDPTNETFYLSNGTSLYTLDPVTGGTVLVGNFVDPAGPAIGLVIDIAINNEGDMYAHSISTDSLYAIDKTTAVATFIGGSGLAANFAQGMDFDPVSNRLYAAIYTGGGTGSYGTWDTTTGVFTEILDLPSFPDPSGGGRELEMAITRLSGGCPCACDFDPDPLCDIFDFLAFQNEFVRGCP